MSDALARRAREDPDGEALARRDRTWTWKELDAAATRASGRIAAGLGPARPETGAALRRCAASGTGVGRGPRDRRARPPVVAAFLPPSSDAVAVIHGVLRTGAVLAPLHRRWTPSERAGLLERLDPELLVVPGEEMEAASEATPQLRCLALEETAAADGGSRRRGERPRREEGPEERAAAGRIAAVLTTSGSTGRARLVVLTQGNLEAAAAGARRALDLRPADRWLASLALSHVGGLALLLRAPVVGSAVVLPDPGGFDPAAWNRLVDRGAVSHLSLVPTMLHRLLDARSDHPFPPSLRCVLLGGASTPASLLDRALGVGVPVALTYGLTEAASQVATAPPELVRRKPGTVGPPLPGTEIRTSDEGEIQVRGPTVMAGYWDDPSEGAFSGEWLRTGDLGRLDADGHLWVEGRRSGRIISGGVNVDPQEVEAVLASHPAVREAVVVGLPDEEWGERVAAAVEVLGEAAAGTGRDADGPETATDSGSASALEASLAELCRRRLAGPKRPRRWLVLETLPRTPTGKADRKAVRRLFPDGEDRN